METATTLATPQNAGQRLWQAQKAQGTGLCMGWDIHYDEKAGLGEEFYGQFHDTHSSCHDMLRDALTSLQKGSAPANAIHNEQRMMKFALGACNYFMEIVLTAWAEGIRVFKPQAAFYEQLQPFGPFILIYLANLLERLARQDHQAFFKLLDAKRGDTADTQLPYYRTYLSRPDQEVFPGLGGLYNFDSMTVTTWMGEDVLTPGLPFFKQGKGATVVTRTSNPSGTTLQDLLIRPNHMARLSEKQVPFKIYQSRYDQVFCTIQRAPTACEMMMNETERFSEANGLGQDGVSALFSVIGSTVKMDHAFRAIRPGAIALVPGFGAQGGEFSNIMPLAVQEGPLAGHVGILSSSRAHDFAWMKKYGGSGNPKNYREDLKRAIAQFREDEKNAYTEAGVTYPY